MIIKTNTTLQYPFYPGLNVTWNSKVMSFGVEFYQNALQHSRIKVYVNWMKTMYFLEQNIHLENCF